jgi:hypothetical protein
MTAPQAIRGYNSRMDNTRSVPGAQLLNDFVADMSGAAAHAAATGDARAKDQILDALANWARQGALTQTRICTSGGNLDSRCTEWTRPDGQDPSAMKDFSAVQMSAAALRRAYLVAARSHARQERAADHAAIERWFGTFDDRMKRPTSVYFGLGLGWYWPAIDAAVMEGRTSRAKSLADKAVRDAGKLIDGDGSIAERTTRGDRALHYHSSALNEIVVTMEMQRALGGRPPRGLEDRLHRAVNLFIRATQDHAVLDPWARQAHNATFRPGRQDWSRNWVHNSWGSSWWHIYAYRYPDRPEAQWIARAISPRSGSARTDEEVGVALGCVYRGARGG